MFQLKRISTATFAAAIFVLFTAVIVSAQVRPPLPRPSQKATVMQTIGTTDVTITYSRPAVKGRQLWGDPLASSPSGEGTLDGGTKGPLVPYGHVWRAGANEATLFTVTDDVLINGQQLAAGKYSMHAIPAKDGEWTIIFNKDDGQWGSFSYDASKDALRIKTIAETTSDSQELLSYYFDPVTDTSARVNLRWEKLRVPFTVEVKNVVAATMGHLRAYVAAGNPIDPVPALNAAQYAKANKQTDDANKWFDQALKLNDAQIATKETFQNLSRKSTILLQMDKMQDALAAAERAVVVGKAAGIDTAALEKRIADIKAGKQ